MLQPLKVVFALSMSLACVATSPSVVWADQVAIACPDSIAPTELAVAKANWTAFVPRPLSLSAAGFMQGEPSLQADLKPTSVRKTATGIVSTWKFAGPYPHGKWLSCDYAGGAVTLSQRIPDASSECSVSYRKNGKGVLAAGEIVCK